MKKIILFIFVLSLTYNLNAQCDSSLPINEGFNDSNSVGLCWDFVDIDNDGNGWSVEDLGSSMGIKSASYIFGYGPTNPDNWIISHPIDLTSNSNVQMSWEVRATAWNSDNENYTVYVATGNQISDFTSSGVFFNENLNGTLGSWQNRNLNISSFSGQMVYVAFRHHDAPGQLEIDIDNLLITSSTLGVDDFDISSFKHYYNTNTDVLTLNSQNTPIKNIEIYNILGQQVLNKKLSNSEENIELSNFTDGIYIANIQIDNVFKTIKFLKQ